MLQHFNEEFFVGECLRVFVRLAYSYLQLDASVVEFFPEVVHESYLFVQHDFLLGGVVDGQHDSAVGPQHWFALLDSLL